MATRSRSLVDENARRRAFWQQQNGRQSLADAYVATPDEQPQGIAPQVQIQQSLANRQASLELLNRSQLAYAGLNLDKSRDQQRAVESQRDFGLRREEAVAADELARRRQKFTEQNAALGLELDQRQQVSRERDNQGSLALANREQDFRQAQPNALDIQDQRYMHDAIAQLDQQANGILGEWGKLSLTPEGEKIRAKLTGMVRQVQGEKMKKRPEQYADLMSQVLGNMENANLTAYAQKQPSPQELFNQSLVQGPGGQVGTWDGKQFKAIEPTQGGEVSMPVGGQASFSDFNVMTPQERMAKLYMGTQEKDLTARENMRSKAMTDLDMRWERENPAVEGQPQKQKPVWTAQQVEDEIYRQFEDEYATQKRVMERLIPKPLTPDSLSSQASPGASGDVEREALRQALAMKAAGLSEDDIQSPSDFSRPAGAQSPVMQDYTPPMKRMWAEPPKTKYNVRTIADGETLDRELPHVSTGAEYARLQPGQRFIDALTGDIKRKPMPKAPEVKFSDAEKKQDTFGNFPKATYREYRK